MFRLRIVWVLSDVVTSFISIVLLNPDGIFFCFIFATIGFSERIFRVIFYYRSMEGHLLYIDRINGALKLIGDLKYLSQFLR